MTRPLCCILFLCMALSIMASENELRNAFRNPPDSIRPKVYWYWINDNISKEGVVKDLEAMHEVGIGGAFIGNIGEQPLGQGPYPLLSDGWWDVTHEALKTATRLGIDIGMFNSPGWSQSGGPWIKPERSMRYLAFSELAVSGPKRIEERIETPGKDFQDVKVLAFKSDKNEGLLKKISVDVKKDAEPAVSFDTETTVRSIVIKTTDRLKGDLEILILRDGKPETVKKARFDRSNPGINVGFIPFAPAVISVPATRATQFRLKFTNLSGTNAFDVEFHDVALLESYAEKTLAKMWPTPLPLWDAYMWPEQPVLDDAARSLRPEGVLDISKHLDKEGILRWDVPEGNWIIQRTGMLTTGVENGPASPAAKGLEVDKMSKKHAAFHFDSYLGKILERIPEADRKSLKVAVQDSYETGGQNWTDDFIDEFKKVYGYDPVPFIPAMNGRVVGSPDLSDRFLWDLRRLVADKVAYDYLGGLREASNRNGMTTWLECYGHWGFPGEFLQYGGQSDGIAGEFWNEGDLGSIENRAASSCGHIYGKTVVTAESFTAAGRVYERHPGLLKKRCDWSYTEGINETLLHLYIHQPYEDKTPGINAWFSTEFNRKNTWFYRMKPFVEYMRRCMFMLQQGLNVADVAYFIGEDCPKMTGVCDPPLPAGYSFDYINGEVIRDRLSVKDGRLVLPHGTSYRVLVLPNQETMRPETLKKIKELVDAGACVVGPAPKRSPSLQDYPRCDKQVTELSAALYEKSRYHRERKTGPVDLADVFRFLKLEPDCLTDDPDTLYVHRTLADGTELYFLTNQVDRPITFSATFRVRGKQPELWNAVDGSIRPLPAFTQREGLTTVPMKLDAWESAFVVFRSPGTPKSAELAANYPEKTALATIEGPWEVRFQSDAINRGPERPKTFEKLIDWSVSDDQSIKYFSGTARYKTTFRLDSIPSGRKTFLDLGQVHVIASVKINGQDAGALWTAPWVLDVSKWVKSGENTLEVEVVNTWVNRLIGDAGLPEAERKTSIPVNPYKADSKLMPSGLTGPVRVLVETP